MVKEHPIICIYCKKDTGYTQERFMFCVIEEDILCPHCGEVVISVPKISWSTTKTSYTGDRFYENNRLYDSI